MTKSLISVLAVIILAAMLMVACAKPAPAPAPTPTPAPAKTLDIGIATPLTGQTSFIGTTIQNAVLLAIEDQNNEGGVTIGGQKYMLNAIVRNTKQDLVLGKSIAEEMIFDKGVKVIMGPFIGDAVGAQSVTEKNKVISFLMQPTLTGMIGPDKPYTFFFGPFPEQLYGNTCAYMQKFYPQGKTVLSVAPDLPSLPLFISAIKWALPKYGLEWLDIDKFPLGSTDLMPVVSRAIARKPDIIDACCAGGMAGIGTLLPKQLREAGFIAPIMMPMSPPKGALEDVVPPQYLTGIVMNDYNIDSPTVTEAFRTEYDRAKKKYQQVPDVFLFTTYNPVKAFFTFLNTQNTMDTTAWMEGFAKYRWQNMWGFESYWVGENLWGINRRVLTCPWVSEYKDGKVATQFLAPLPYEMFAEK